MGSTQNSKGYIQFGWGIYIIIRLKNQILNIPSISFLKDFFFLSGFFPWHLCKVKTCLYAKWCQNVCLHQLLCGGSEMFIIDGHLFVSSSFFREKKEGGKRDDWSHTKSIFCMLENRVATSSGKVVVKASFFPTWPYKPSSIGFFGTHSYL